MTVVAIDAMGGDHAPRAVVEGALAAARDPGLEVVLVGRTANLVPLLSRAPSNVRLQDAADVVDMADQPAATIRQKRRSSIMVGLELLQRGDAGAFVSFGNTGAIMAASLITLGRIPGVDRPALGAVFHSARGSNTLLLDVGASVDCRPAYLAQFATMGKAYFERVLRQPDPTVGLLNVGEEESKGNLLAREAYALLRRTEPNFVGNIEGNALLDGHADVVVTDGFNGNIAVKVAEGVAAFLAGQLRRGIRSKPRYVAGAWFIRGAFAALRESMDYRRVGGAPLFGVNGAVIIGHGRAEAQAVTSGVRLARNVAESRFVLAIREALRPPDSPPVGPRSRAGAPSEGMTEPAESAVNPDGEG